MLTCNYIMLMLDIMIDYVPISYDYVLCWLYIVRCSYDVVRHFILVTFCTNAYVLHSNQMYSFKVWVSFEDNFWEVARVVEELMIPRRFEDKSIIALWYLFMFKNLYGLCPNSSIQEFNGCYEKGYRKEIRLSYKNVFDCMLLK